MKPGRLIISFFIAVSFALTACSGGGSTTAASSTETQTTTALTATPDTRPVTTDPRTDASSDTRPSATTGTSENDVTLALAKSYEQLEQLDNYRITTVTKSTTPGNSIVATSVMDLFPKEDRIRMITDSPGMKMESYVVDRKMYTRFPDGNWTVAPMTDASDPNDSTRTLPYMEFPELFQIEETASGYLIRTIQPLTLADLEELERNQPGAGGSYIPEDGDAMDMTYDMEMKLSDAYLIETTTMNIKMIMDGSEILREIQMTYSDFNSLEPFELPQEALDAAEVSQP